MFRFSDVENDSFLTNFDDDSKRMKREQRETYSKGILLSIILRTASLDTKLHYCASALPTL